MLSVACPLCCLSYDNLQATYYGEYPGGGACALDLLPTLGRQPGWIQVAVGKYDFQNSLGCGMCLEIYGSGTAAAPDLSGTTPVKGILNGFVTDLCGSCKQGHVNTSYVYLAYKMRKQ